MDNELSPRGRKLYNDLVMRACDQADRMTMDRLYDDEADAVAAWQAFEKALVTWCRFAGDKS